MQQDPRSGCPINQAVEAFGDRWSLLVVRDIMFGNRRHFRELLAGSEEGIASNILANRLKRLVATGLLTRDGAGRGQKATYSLTEQSIQLVPVFAQLGAWGRRHRTTTTRLSVRAELLEAGGPELWSEFMTELRTVHLGTPPLGDARPTVTERLARAYAEVVNQQPNAAGQVLPILPPEHTPKCGTSSETTTRTSRKVPPSHPLGCPV